MQRSFSESIEIVCPGCGGRFDAEVWLIVDAAERADLVARILDESIRTLRCPLCGATHTIDAPLLLHDPAAESVVFAGHEHADPADEQSVARRLGQQLIGAIPIEQRRPYLANAQIVRGIAGLRQWLDARANDALSQAIPALMTTASLDEIIAVAEAHPVLLTAEAQQHLREYVDRLQANEPVLAAALEQRLDALDQARPQIARAVLEALLDAEGPEQRRAVLIQRRAVIDRQLAATLQALADQAQRRELDAVARDMLVIRDEVLQMIGHTHKAE